MSIRLITFITKYPYLRRLLGGLEIREKPVLKNVSGFRPPCAGLLSFYPKFPSNPGLNGPYFLPKQAHPEHFV